MTSPLLCCKLNQFSNESSLLILKIFLYLLCVFRKILAKLAQRCAFILAKHCKPLVTDSKYSHLVDKNNPPSPLA